MAWNTAGWMQCAPQQIELLQTKHSRGQGSTQAADAGKPNSLNELLASLMPARALRETVRLAAHAAFLLWPPALHNAVNIVTHVMSGSQVYVPPHPLAKHWLAIARNAATPSALFRSACSELGRILIYEAVREFLPTIEGQVDTPVGKADVEFVDPTKPIKVTACCQGQRSANPAGKLLSRQEQQEGEAGGAAS